MRAFIALLAILFPITAIAQQVAPQPEVRLCNADDLRGFWKLRNVIETPAGEYTKRKADIPHQYMYFDKSGVMYMLGNQKVIRQRQNLLKMMSAAAKQAEEVRQFVIDEKGALFFYINSKHTETWYCGRVQTTVEPYIQGDLLLTPAQKTEGYSLYTMWKRPGFAGSRMPRVTPRK